MNLSKSLKISIEGNIGCGKSTTCQNVLSQLRMPVFLEPVETWTPYLNEFYKDPRKWGLSFNINVLLSYQKWKHNAFTAIYERSPMACKYVFTKQQIKDNHIHPLELDIFNQLYNQISWEPDVIIYISASPELCHSRMKIRGRECENTVSLEYLQAIHKNYEEFFQYIEQERKDIRVYKIDGNRDKQSVADDVCRIISTYS